MFQANECKTALEQAKENLLYKKQANLKFWKGKKD